MQVRKTKNYYNPYYHVLDKLEIDPDFDIYFILLTRF